MKKTFETAAKAESKVLGRSEGSVRPDKPR
jgi:hypothetical protein